MAGRKTLYNPNNFPLLAEGYARNGLNDRQIAKNLGIGVASFYLFINEYSEFSDAIKRGRKPVDIEVENALLKRALGFEYEEKTTEVEIGVDGMPQPSRIKTVKKIIPPDTGAIAFWLKNRKKSEWKDRHSHELGGEDGKPILVENKNQIDYSKLPTEVLEAIVNARIKPDSA